ncbi:MAG: hypothetical protein WCV86_02500 [Patescibacteria group bacterium]|jgi:hypothetical protein
MADIQDIFSPAQPSLTPERPQAPQKQGDGFQAPQKRGRKRFIWGIITALAILFFGGTAFGMYQGWIPTPTQFFNNRATAVFSKTIEQLFSIESAKYHIDLDVSVQPRDADAIPIDWESYDEAMQNISTKNTNMSNASSWLQPNIAHAQSAFSIDSSAANVGIENIATSLPSSGLDSLFGFVPNNMDMTLSMNGIFKKDIANNGLGDTEFGMEGQFVFNEIDEGFAMQMRLIENNLYALISTLPSLANDLVGNNTDLTPLLNTWIHLEKDSALGEILGLGTINTTPDATPPSSKENTTIETAQEISSALVTQGLFTIRKDLGKEMINNVNTRHLRVGTNPKNIRPALTAALQILSEKNQSIEIPFIGSDDVFAIYDDPAFLLFLDSLQQNSYVDVWIDAQTDMPVKTEIWLRLIPTSANILPDKQLVMRFSLTLTDVNQPIIIQNPTNAVDIDTIAQETFGLTDADMVAYHQLGSVNRVRNALRDYSYDNEYTYPTSLEQLTPKYLEEIPLDQYTKKPFTYHLDTDNLNGYLLDFQGPPSVENLQNPISLLMPYRYDIGSLLPNQTNIATAFQFSGTPTVLSLPTEEELQPIENQRQTGNISTLHNLLKYYYVDNGIYPETLNDLLATADAWNEAPPSLIDIVTGENFNYSPTAEGTHYKLLYQLQGETGTVIVGNFGFIAGLNTATDRFLSLEGGASAGGVEETVDIFDADGDKLHDAIEYQYGTDKNNTDTDGDGFDDYIEISNGFNPNGSGNLEPLGSEYFPQRISN